MQRTVSSSPMRASVLVASLLGATGSSASLAHAQRDSRQSVAIVVEPAEDADAMNPALAAALIEQGWSGTPATARAIGAKLAACQAKDSVKDSTSCTARLIRRVKEESVLFVRSERTTDDEGEPHIVLYGRLIARESGATLGTTERYCLRCRETERFTALGAEMARELIRARAHQLAPHTAIKVIAQPDDAVVQLDGVDAGPVGNSYRVPPGPMKVTVAKAGYQSVEKQVDIRPNQELTLEIQLVPGQGSRVIDPDPHQDAHDGPRPSPVPWIVGGVGAAGLGMGVAWIARHQEPVENGVRLKTRRNSMTRGIVATSVGAALVGTAVVLWYRDKGKRKRKEKAPDVIVAPTQDGAVVLWDGRF